MLPVLSFTDAAKDTVPVAVGVPLMLNEALPPEFETLRPSDSVTDEPLVGTGVLFTVQVYPPIPPVALIAPL